MSERERERERERESVYSDERGRGKGRGCKCRSSMVKVHWPAQLHYFEPLPSPTSPLNHHPPLPILAAARAEFVTRATVFLRTITRCMALGVRFRVPSGVEIYTALSNFDRKREKRTLANQAMNYCLQLSRQWRSVILFFGDFS